MRTKMNIEAPIIRARLRTLGAKLWNTLIPELIRRSGLKTGLFIGIWQKITRKIDK